MSSAVTAAKEGRTDNREIIHRIYHSLTSQGTASIPCLLALNNFFSLVKEAFPDYELTIHNLFAKEDMVMARYSISGTQKGSFMGIEATFKPMTISGIDVFKLDKGEVVTYWDAAHQIGAF